MIIIITIITIHLAGSPGSYFAYLKDCLEEWSKNKIKNNACRGEFKIRKEKKKAGRSSFFWTGAALATQGRYLLGRGRKLKKKKKKKKKKKTEREPEREMITLRRSWALNARFKTFAMKITFPLSSISKQRSLALNIMLFIYLYEKKTRNLILKRNLRTPT